MAQSVWKGYISLGLASVPIRFRRPGHRMFNFTKFIGRVARVFTSNHIVRMTNASYRETKLRWSSNLKKDQYVLVEREELKKLQPASSKAIDIVQFVKLSEVDPVNAASEVRKSRDKCKVAQIPPFPPC